MNVSCDGLILLLRGRVGHVGGERDEEWRCRQTAFPSRMAASLGLEDTCWDFQLDSVGPECPCPASPAGLFGSSFIFLLGSWSSVANTLLFFPKTVMGLGSL